MRPIWSGMLSFGLVNIPVALYPATEDADLHLHLLHKEDHGRIKNQRVCSVDGKPVDYDDLVKGYEYEKGKFVTITDDDLEDVKVTATERIVIEDFVKSEEIDPKFFEKPYYVLPGKKSDAPYALLREALKESAKIGIARIVIRTRERLAAVRADGAAIMLDTMHFADEIRPAEGLPAEVSPVGKREMDMAKMLIDAMTTTFTPEKYQDSYREALNEMIRAKVAGKEVVQTEEQPQPTEIIDLMKYLKESIESKGQQTNRSDDVEEKPQHVEKKPRRKSTTAA